MEGLSTHADSHCFPPALSLCIVLARSSDTHTHKISHYDSTELLVPIHKTDGMGKLQQVSADKHTRMFSAEVNRNCNHGGTEQVEI